MIDVMDVSGEQQVNVDDNLFKQYVNGSVSRQISSRCVECHVI